MRGARKFASERDFVARFLYPCLQEASSELGISESMDIFIEKKINGIPDVVVEKDGKSLFIIEAKFKKKIGSIERDIEPRDPSVVGQAIQYANFGGFPFYATCNVNRLVLFQLRPGIKALESIIESYEYDKISDWAKSVLEITLGLVPIKLKPLDDSLVDTLHEAFNDLYPEFLKSLRQRLREKHFNESYIEWLESQGLELSEETNRIIAAQATYLELNKFLFYNVIRHIYPERLKQLRIEEYEDVAESLSKFYDTVLEIDYAPIYEKGILNEISLTKRAEVRIRTLLDTLDEFDFSKMESDFLGQLYEKLIPADERKRLGQFYTPPGIVDLITRLTVKNEDEVIIDPGCGSGSFLVCAYHRLRELKGYPRISRGLVAYTHHQELIDQIYGIDINQFPAHLSVINISIQNPRARINKVNILVEDFFNIKPGVTTLVGFTSFTTEGAGSKVTLPPFFDTIVANPPYIRQELLGTAEKKRIKNLIEKEYLNQLFIGSGSKRAKKSITLNKQSDIFIYFFIHGLKLIREKGRLGFITSNKWLEVAYGKPFQEFLLRNTKILSIIEFDRAIFPDADVNTAVTILEKEGNESKRDSNIVKFIRFKKKLDRDTMIELVEKTNRSYEDENVRINIVKQNELVSGKWNIYLRAPPVYNRIVKHEKVRPLVELGQVFRGPTTGYNPYFILQKERARNIGIEEEYIKPCLTSPKKIKNLVVEDTDDFLFCVRENKTNLKATNALQYIEFGENLEIEVKRGSERGPRKLQDVATLKHRKPYWYSLPDLSTPDILIPKLADERMIALYNKSGVQASDVFYYVLPHEKKGIIALTGFLNSSIGGLLGELFGRSYGGGVLDVKVYEVKQIPVLDASKLSQSEITAIETAFLKLVEAIEKRNIIEGELKKVKSKLPSTIGLFEHEAKAKLGESLENEKNARKKLDKIIYNILGFSDEESRQVEEGLKELQTIRRLRTKT